MSEDGWRAENTVKEMEKGLGPWKQVYLTVCGPGIIRKTPHGCNDERNRELCVLGVLPLIRGPEERTLQPLGPWLLLANVMLMKEAQGVNGEASLLRVC